MRTISAALCVIVAWLSGSFAIQAADDKSDAVFGLSRLHRVHLTVAAGDFRKMTPPPPKFPPPGDPAENPDAGAGNFGFDFKFVPADLDVDGTTLKKIGLRYKGSGTYLFSQSLTKRSFKFDFDRYDNDQRFHGLTKLNLNSGIMDRTKAREALGYWVYREAGVPTPRTAFAEVALTVPGKFNRENLGVYTVVEQVEEPFLESAFGSGKGLLLKPEGVRGLPHYGDDVAAYEKNYVPKSKAKLRGWRRLAEFTRLVNRANDEEFQRRIGEQLDLENFAGFLAASAILASMDGFIGLGHNYYLYLSPKSGKFAFIPWDLDLAFGAFAIYGKADQMADLSVDHPHLGENKLIDRLLAMPEFKSAYRDRLRKLATETFAKESLGKRLSEIESTLKAPIERDRKAVSDRKEKSMFGSPEDMFAPMPLAPFIEKRTASVMAQLEGKKKGYVPQFSMFVPPPAGSPEEAKLKRESK